MFVHLGTFSIAALSLVPIVIGSAICGPWAGAWLGAVFGFMTLIDPSTSLFYILSPLGTIITVMIKGICAGLFAGLIYKALAKKSRVWAVSLAAILSPITNTAIFTLGCYAFFLPTIKTWAAFAGIKSAAYFIFTVLIGFNFFIELALNIVLIGAILAIIRIKEGDYLANS